MRHLHARHAKMSRAGYDEQSEPGMRKHYGAAWRKQSQKPDETSACRDIVVSSCAN